MCWFLDFVFKDKDKGIHRLFVRFASCHTAVMKLIFAIFKLLLSGKFEEIAFQRSKD
jgi:hypothetical protein